MENMHKGHRERLKNRFLKEGLSAFEDHQVLELLLYYGIPYKDTNGTAHELLRQYGSLSAVLEADANDLVKIAQIGNNTAVLLKLIPEITKRYFHDRWKDRPGIDNTTKAGQYAITLFVGEENEIFYLICLNAQNQVNMAVPVFKGTINEAPVYPRLIIENALRYHANGVILAHNHPGGSVQPSRADIEVTEKLNAALNMVAIHLIDHIIVAGPQYLSFAERGLLQK